LIRRGGIRYIRGALAPLKHPVRLKYLSGGGSYFLRGSAPLTPLILVVLATFDPANMGKFKRGRQPPLSITSPSCNE
jgi:hypothetical protein